MKTKVFNLFAKGSKVLIRTVTNYQVGETVSIESIGEHQFILLKDASWVADTKCFSEALTKGFSQLAEIEPIPGICAVSAGSIVDVFEWSHPLPTSRQ